MLKMAAVISATVLVLTPLQIVAQSSNNATGVFTKSKSEYYDEINKKVEEFRKKPKGDKLSYKVDLSTWNLPKSKSEFTYFWHNEPINQGITGTCWSFCTTSLFESEVYRLHKREVKLSQMWNAYWEYLEKGKRFIETRGKSTFGEGSQGNAVRRIYKEKGVVPREVYNGLLPNQEVFDHAIMFKEMNDYLNSAKANNLWSVDAMISTFTSILNHYMGVPPTKFTYQGKEYTPKSFFAEVVDLNMDDYVDLISLKSKPYYTQMAYDVPDNWWKDSSYYNLPLETFISVMKKSIKSGYTFMIAGDVSEPGLDSHFKVGVIPSFDIPSEAINDDARQFRFYNETTTDDHGIHVVGYEIKDGKEWFLIKDSGSGSFNVGDKGYYFFNEDYMKLKIMAFVVHKDMMKDELPKFNK